MEIRLAATSIAGFALILLSGAGADAQVVRPITDVRNARARAPRLDTSGNVYVAASGDALGANPRNAFQIFRLAAATGVATQLTSFPEGVWDALVGVSVSDDGQWLAFVSRGSLTGQNHDRSAELYVMKSDGTQLAQLTSDPGPDGGAVKLVAIAGSASRLAFVSNSDPTGGNPGRHDQIFSILRDGTGLTQVTSFGGGEIPSLSVSDDGLRIAFTSNADPLGTNADGNHEAFSVSWDGTGLRQLTAATIGETSWVVLSGNGSKIAFESSADLVGSNGDLGRDVFEIDWGGSVLRQISASPVGRESRYPAITDDGLVVYYASNKSNFNWRLWKVNSDGTGTQQVSTTTIHAELLTVSGNGSTLSWLSGGSVQSIATGGTNLRTLASDAHFTVDTPSLSADGSLLAFISSANLTGGNPGGLRALYVVHADGSGLTQLVSGASTFDAEISSDGSVVYFTEIPPNSLEEIFRVNTDGSGIARLTFSLPGDFTYASQPALSHDGTTLLIASSENFTGQNADNSGEIFRMSPDGTSFQQLTFSEDPVFHRNYHPRVDASGTWVVFGGDSDPTGGNADHTFEIWRIRSDGTAIEQLTSSESLDSQNPDISPDGTKIVYSSYTDPLGTNPDGNAELYLLDVTSGSTRQLTSTTDGDHLFSRFSGNGRWIYFFSDGSDVEPNLHGRLGLYRVDPVSGEIRRADGLPLGPGYYVNFPNLLYYYPAVSDDGRAAFTLPGDFARSNPDEEPELLYVDLDAAPGITVSPGPAPTTISWDVESGVVRYDVVRGDVASLRSLAGAIDLGVVSCLENDSADNDTSGFADADTPAPGRTFFYVYRGSPGLTLGPGTYGTGSSGLARAPSSGDCAQ